MNAIAIIGFVFGLAGILFGCKCYHELWKWARYCQGTRIAIAYKTKVKMQPTLTEVISWANALDKDRDSNGRVIFRMGHASVAIMKRPPTRFKLALRKHRRPQTQTQRKVGVREGTWKATDHTKGVTR